MLAALALPYQARSVVLPRPTLVVPPRLARNVRQAFGAAGQRWLRALPSLQADLARAWDLRLGPPFDLSYHYVAPAYLADGREAVLKLGVPTAELAREIAALDLYAGVGACHLLRADAARGALLLERARPGQTLVDLARADDAQATRVGARVMRALWRPAPPETGFRPLAAWFAAFGRHRHAFGGAGPLPTPVFEHAEGLARALLTSAPTTVLLHGDLHHANILSAERAPWLAIDPKGVVGDPGYEVGPFLCNPRRPGRPRSAGVLRRRLDILADELGYDRERLRQWGIAHAVLSACWSVEDGDRGWRATVAAAEHLMRG